MSALSFQTKTVRRVFRAGSIDVLCVCARFPHIDGLPQANSFYAACTAGLMRAAGKRTARASALCRKNGGIPAGITLNARVTHQTDHLLSALTDVMTFDGTNTKTVRSAQLWQKDDGLLLDIRILFKADRRSTAALFNALHAAVSDAASHGTVRFRPGTEALLPRRFRTANCCLVPRGFAFFFPNGTFEGDDTCIPLFTLPPEVMREYIKSTFYGFVNF